MLRFMLQFKSLDEGMSCFYFSTKSIKRNARNKEETQEKQKLLCRVSFLAAQ